MAQLPDAASVYGTRTIPRSRRGVVSADGSAIAEGAAKAGAALSKVGSDIQQYAEDKIEEEDKFSVAAAKSQYTRDLMNARQEIDANPDYTQHERLFNEQEAQIRANALSLVKSKKYGEALGFDLENARLSSLENIRSGVQKKQIDAGQAFLMKSIDDNVKLLSYAKDDAEFNSITANTVALLESASQPNKDRPAYIDQVAMYKMVKDLNENAGQVWLQKQTPEKQAEVLKTLMGRQSVSGDYPLSTRNNNPGNIRGADGNFLSFAHAEDGLAAMRHDLIVKITGKSGVMKGKYGDGYSPTLANVIATWAPPSENNTQAYIDFVSKKTGIKPYQNLTVADVDKVTAAMVEQEGGTKAVDYFYGPNKQAGRSYSPADSIPSDKLAPLVESLKKNVASQQLDADPSKFALDLASGAYAGIFDAEETLKWKDAATKRALDTQESATQMEVLNVIKDEKSLLAQSLTSTTPLSMSQLQDEFAKSNISPAAQKFFLKANGFSEIGVKPMNTTEKIQARSDIYEEIQLLDKEDLTSQDINRVQNLIFEGMTNDALTPEEGAKLLDNIIDPVVKRKEAALSSYQVGEWNPFQDNLGFSGIKKMFKDDFEIPLGKKGEGATAAEKKQYVQNQNTNKANKVKLYDYYLSSLQIAADTYKVNVASLSEMPKSFQRKIYNEAMSNARALYLTDQHPALSTLTDAPNQILSGNRLVQGMAGNRNLKAEASVAAPYETVKRSDGVLFKKYPDGTLERM